jgi:hypothetical protein
VDAAICILTGAQTGASGGSASVSDACPASTGTSTSTADGGATTPSTDTTTAPGVGGNGGGTAPMGTVPADATTEPAVGSVTSPRAGAAAPASLAGTPQGMTLAGLPSSATATAGLGLFVATTLALAALGKRRRR